MASCWRCEGDLEDRGGMIAFNTPVERLRAHRSGWEVAFRRRARPARSTVDAVVNSAGLGAQTIARATEGYPPARVPRLVLAKGNYFGFTGKPAFSHLIYPAPVEGGLGTHVTLDMAGRMRFGPDVEWIEAESYTVDPKRADSFYASVRTYFPALPDNSLVPDYCGIRPKLTGKGEPAADFLIDGPAAHGLPRLVHLFGIELPGSPRRSRSPRRWWGSFSEAQSSGRSSASGSPASSRPCCRAAPPASVTVLRACAVLRRPRSAAFWLSPVATMSPGRKVGSAATSIFARPNVSLPLQVQPVDDLLAIDERVVEVGVARAVAATADRSGCR